MDLFARGLAANIDLKRAVNEFVYFHKVNTYTFRVYYKPPGSKWVRYEFLKTNDVPNNYDIWVLYSVYTVDIAEFSPLVGITESNALSLAVTSSQWPYAIQIQGSPDYFGGFHGDDKLQGALFMFNSKSILFTSLSVGEVKAIKQFELSQHSICYNPSDGTTKTGDMYARYIFTPQGLDLKLNFIWAGSFTVDSAYMGMLPCVRSATTTAKCRFIERVTEYDISAAGHAASNGVDSYGVELWNASNNLGIRVEHEDMSFFNSYTNSGGRGIFVSGDAAYNKVYPTRILSPATESVSSSDKWKAHIKYRVYHGM